MVILSFVVTYLGVWVLNRTHLCSSYASHCASFFIFFVLWKILSPSLHVVTVNSYSVKSCNLGAPMGRDELRVSLLYHLGHTKNALMLSQHLVYFVFHIVLKEVQGSVLVL